MNQVVGYWLSVSYTPNFPGLVDMVPLPPPSGYATVAKANLD